MNESLLEVRNLSMRFRSAEGELSALEGIDFNLERREFVCIIGPSGAGKSTLLRILAGVLVPDSGEIIYNTEEKLTRAIVFQDSNLLPWLSTLDNIALPLLIKGVPRNEALDQAQDWLKKIGLQGFEKEWPKNLSGGMAQRVALARALIQKPQLLLLDEPFGALDALTREQISLELLQTWEQLDNTVLMVTHSLSEAALLSDRILIYSQRPGCILAEVVVPFAHPRDPELRDTQDFIELTRSLRKLVITPDIRGNGADRMQ